MRLVAAAAMFMLAGLAHAMNAVDRPLRLYVLAALTLAVDLYYMRWYRNHRQVSHDALRRHVDVQIGVDLIILTAILHYSGGITNPLVLFYFFHAFIAALLHSVRAALIVVAVSVVLVAGLTLLERSGAMRHHPLSFGLMDLMSASPLTLGYWLVVFTVTGVLSVYFVATVLRQLVRREALVVDLDRQLAHSEKLASIGNLAAGVAHEINNPVGVIQNKVQILRYRISDGEPEQVLLDELDTVEKHVRRIRGITEGLLTFSRESPFELAPIRLDKLVREGAELVTVPFKNAGVKLELDANTEDLRVLGSANHLLQVLVNIMLNAKDASRPDEVVHVATSRRGDRAAIRIEDHGEGIPADNLSKIFDPFFTTKDVDRGTGLGLAISHGIIERHGGRIEVDSAEGEGTSFTVWLQVASDTAS